jgi:hypothetical protein
MRASAAEAGFSQARRDIGSNPAGWWFESGNIVSGGPLRNSSQTGDEAMNLKIAAGAGAAAASALLLTTVAIAQNDSANTSNPGVSTEKNSPMASDQSTNTNPSKDYNNQGTTSGGYQGYTNTTPSTPSGSETSPSGADNTNPSGAETSPSGAATGATAGERG